MWRLLVLVPLLGVLSGCAYFYSRPPTRVEAGGLTDKIDYVIGTGDSVQVFVWRNPDLSIIVGVRPDGKISVPLIQDVQAAGRTPGQLSEVIAAKLGKYVQEPQVTVIVQSATGQNETAVKVIGEAVQPRVIPYHVGMTLIEVMASVGGLTDFADGNRSYLIRYVNGQPKRYHLRIASLLRSGDMRTNIELAPGDIISIPQRWY
ncbi:MAG: XrtA/PEP-CTERM system exopolysaccharide export protein [Alphaproteobacteria bacterium]